MRIVTVTFHRAENYGAVLQCYALQQALIKLGCETEVLDYGEDLSVYRPMKGKLRYLHRRVGENIRRFKNRETIAKRQNRFSTFVTEHIRRTERYHTLEELRSHPPYADKYITGSDQVFNPGMSAKNREVYLLSFLPDTVEKYSYAASLGNYKPAQTDTQFWQAVKQFRTISMREREGMVQMLQSGCACREDIDPVFLLSKEDWKKLIPKNKEVYALPQHYIFVFELIPREDMQTVIEQLKRTYSYEVVVLSLADGSGYTGDYLIKDAGPIEFLWLIDHADVVVSTSYHGAVLSLIMEKEVYAMPAASRVRFDSIFEALGISQRVCMPGETMDETPINYIEIKRLVNAMRDKSELYLREISGIG